MGKGFNGFGGGMGGGNLQQLMKQAQKMQEQMQQSQEELEQMEMTATSGGGMVEVTISGMKVLKSIKIKPEAVDPEDVEMLEDLIIAAINEGYVKAEKVYQEKMGPMGSLKL